VCEETDDRKGKILGRKAVFLADFGPNYPPWSIKIKYIYSRCNRDTFSLLVQNLSPWFDPKVSEPLAQSSNDELSVLCRKMVGRVGQFGTVPPPLQPQSAQKAYTSVYSGIT
jgi:hypothetical protein